MSSEIFPIFKTIFKAVFGRKNFYFRTKCCNFWGKMKMSCHTGGGGLCHQTYCRVGSKIGSKRNAYYWNVTLNMILIIASVKVVNIIFSLVLNINLTFVRNDTAKAPECYNDLQHRNRLIFFFGLNQRSNKFNPISFLERAKFGNTSCKNQCSTCVQFPQPY